MAAPRTGASKDRGKDHPDWKVVNIRWALGEELVALYKKYPFLGAPALGTIANVELQKHLERCYELIHRREAIMGDGADAREASDETD